MIRPKIKICCISSVEEAKLAISMGVSAIGLVSEMPSGPGIITEQEITEIVKVAPKHISTFLLTSKQNTKAIVEQLRKCNTNTVQIVDDLIEGNYSEIRAEFPNIKIVQVLHVQNNKSIDKAIKLSQHIDAILLDSGNPNLETKELGGTGKIHDWSISKVIIRSVNIPVYLAGGINSNNVVNAIKTVNPYGIDLCSSVRTNGKLDKYKLTDFFNAVNSI